MLYKKVECPNCGNEVTAKSVDEPQKCCWCRRLFTAKFIKRKGKKWNCEVEPAEFTEERRRPNSYNNWRDEDIYGKR